MNGVHRYTDGGDDFVVEGNVYGIQLVFNKSYRLHFVEVVAMLTMKGDLEVMCQPSHDHVCGLV